MPVNIHNLIAVINPDIYCDSSVRKEVKKLVKENLTNGDKEAYIKAAAIAKPFQSAFLFNYDDAKKNPLLNWGLKSPSEYHQIEYDSPAEGLEPLYFWTLDFMERMFPKVEKLTDNFISSPGSGHFSDLSGKASRMQEEAMKMLGATNQVIKTILNILYDLKDFKLLLANYDDLHSKDETTKRASLLSLKQRWMDVVDFAKRGTTSLKQLAAQMDFVTIIDAFMAANTLEEVEKLDLNDRVKRILKQRVADFNHWLEQSEMELRKRYNIEKTYLRNQVNTVKLYSRWIKPYLKTAKQLEQHANTRADLVTTFNTIILELTLLTTTEYKPGDDVKKGNLPAVFERVKARKYSQVVIVEFRFRGIPQRVQAGQGHWGFGGKTTITLTSYALNEEELKVLKDQIEKDDFGEVMKLIEDSTDVSLKELQNDIDEFLDESNETKKKQAEEKRRSEQDVNPFAALFDFLKTSNKKKEKKEFDALASIKSDNDYEKVIRSQAIIEARDQCFTIFDIYKRAHGMPAHENPFG